MARRRGGRGIARGAGGARPRLAAAVQLLALYGATVGVLTFLSPGVVIGGPALPKLLFLLRMAVLLAVATGLLWMRGLGWADVGLRRPKLGRFLLAVTLGFLACALAAASVRIAQGALGQHGAVGPAKDYAMFQPLAHHLPEYLFWLFATWTTAAFGEEMLFRGFVLDAIQRILGGRSWAVFAAVILQGLLFGVLHLYQGLNGAEVATALGIMLGFVWWASGRNLWAGVLIHGAFDSLAMTVIYLGLLPH
ncbi:MAG: CPBP family intramembrane metalloprotease [Caulobacteraceae bacterium]|nr:CPBP family intramembrane metalloprotease [Caulobacter sp.]